MGPRANRLASSSSGSSSSLIRVNQLFTDSYLSGRPTKATKPPEFCTSSMFSNSLAVWVPSGFFNESSAQKSISSSSSKFMSPFYSSSPFPKPTPCILSSMKLKYDVFRRSICSSSLFLLSSVLGVSSSSSSFL
jgi:hypothetical protein